MGAERKPFILLRSNGERVWNRSDPAISPQSDQPLGVNRAPGPGDGDNNMEDAIKAMHRDGFITDHVDGSGAAELQRARRSGSSYSGGNTACRTTFSYAGTELLILDARGLGCRTGGQQDG